MHSSCRQRYNYRCDKCTDTRCFFSHCTCDHQNACKKYDGKPVYFLKADFRSRIGSPSILKIARNTIAKNNGVVAVNLSSKRNAADSGARKDKNPGTSQKTNTIRLTTATIFSFFSILPGHLLSNKEKSTVSKCEISGLTTNRNQSNIPIQIINPIGIPISIYPNIFAGCPVIPRIYSHK